MVRKELKIIEADEADMVCSCDDELLLKSEADAVMDAQEARIKELEARLGTDHIVDANKMMWVSVKERLPDDAKRVIVSDNIVKKDRTIIGQYIQEASCEEGIFVDPLGYPLQHVTHWMPLPMPPKESKDA